MKKSEERYKFIGSRIREAREKIFMSQKILAEALGYESATAISLIESGERKVKIEDLEKIADILKKRLEYFLGEEKKQIDIITALRATKNIPDSDKKVIERIIELAKQRHDDNAKH